MTAIEAQGKNVPPRSNPRLRKLLRSLWGLAVFLAVLLILRLFFFAPYRISTGSMEPALQGDHPDQGVDGDTVLVLKSAYWFSKPRRWELAAFRMAENCKDRGGSNLVKRIAGLPGETVEIRSHCLWIDGRPAALPEHLPADNYINKGLYGTSPIRLGENEYFMLGDNSYLSEDSRHWGPLPGENIFGRVIWILQPWSRFGPAR